MSKHIRAEWFRILHSGNNFWQFIVASVFMCFYPFSGQWEILNEPLSVCIAFYLKDAYIMFFVIELVTIIMLVSRYQNRTYYYEIMNGTGIWNIIGSKLIVYSIYSIVAFVIPNVILYTVLAVRNGVGEFKNVGMLLLLFTIIMIRIVVQSVLVTMIVRRIIPAFAILMSLFFSSLIVITLVDSLDGLKQGVIDVFFDFFPIRQVMKLYEPITYSGKFVGIVFLSFVIEGVILYVLTWWNYKRKKFR